MRIVVLDGFTLNPGDLSWERWKALGDFSVFDRTPPELILQRAQNAEILITNKTPITADTIAALPSLQYIGVLATGYNVVDIKAAEKRGITVTNVPAYSTNSVAQLVFAFILEHAQKLSVHNTAVHRGEWQNSNDFCFTHGTTHEIAGKTLGIVGLGAIGKKVAEIGHAFGMNVMALCRHPKRDIPQWISIVPKDELFKSADFLTLHCPLTDDTHHLVNSHALSMMKPTAFLINTSRGPVVDEQALAYALQNKLIAGAGVDVLTQEPPKDGSPLLSLPNCFITPHLAWATQEARKRLEDIAFNNIKAFLTGKPQNAVTQK